MSILFLISFNAVAGNCHQIEVKILFLKSLCNSIGKTA